MKTSDVFVSVVIPTYSRNDMLVNAINSVLKQTHQNFEILVIDDNKEDSEWRKSTEELMKAYDKDARIRYIKNSVNMGGSGARNEGIKASKGDYIAFLDDDDEYYPERIEKQIIKFLESDNDKLALVYCDAKFATNKGDVNYVDRKRYKGNCLYEAMYCNCIAATSQWMTKKSALVAVDGFTVVPSKQDSQLILKLLKNGYEVDYVPEILSKYLIPDGKSTNISSSPKIIQGEMLYRDACRECYGNLTEEQIQNVEMEFHKKLYIHYRQLKNKNGWVEELNKLKQTNKKEYMLFRMKIMKKRIGEFVKKFI